MSSVVPALAQQASRRSLSAADVDAITQLVMLELGDAITAARVGK